MKNFHSMNESFSLNIRIIFHSSWPLFSGTAVFFCLFRVKFLFPGILETKGAWDN